MWLGLGWGMVVCFCDEFVLMDGQIVELLPVGSHVDGDGSLTGLPLA